jgi:hypothetical protein
MSDMEESDVEVGVEVDSDDVESMEATPKKPTKGRKAAAASNRGRGGRSAARGGKRAKAVAALEEESSEGEDDEDQKMDVDPRVDNEHEVKEERVLEAREEAEPLDVDFSMPEPVPVFEKLKRDTRLIITHLELENFKSYGGIRKIGPFHKVRAFGCELREY